MELHIFRKISQTLLKQGVCTVILPHLPVWCSQD